MNAETIAKYFIKLIILWHRSPTTVLSDQGKVFIRTVMTEIKKQLNIKQATTTAYHPQTNGLVERFNWTMKEMLSMFIAENQKNWDKYLPYIVYAYNTSVYASTNETPFYLNHAYNSKQPMWLNM